ncbi:MAG: hypothetical protein J07HQW2_00168 [Haloquadratum walsbyi J07HQW2]|uniref:Uncharacterized protein n=1 Tax=Haloquadratum walsbyi J07HQW2 TaxID=1238425 RepID=U1MTW1_9EURY|nr:MAG: hypothetical protein J07HQW2_00168 [Haloquadratum walsbyi J07HQW2]
MDWWKRLFDADRLIPIILGFVGGVTGLSFSLQGTGENAVSIGSVSVNPLQLGAWVCVFGSLGISPNQASSTFTETGIRMSTSRSGRNEISLIINNESKKTSIDHVRNNSKRATLPRTGHGYATKHLKRDLTDTSKRHFLRVMNEPQLQKEQQ